MEYLKNYIKDSFTFFVVNLKTILKIILPFAIPMSIVEVMINSVGDVDLVFLLSGLLVLMLFYPIYHGAIILFIAHKIKGDEINIINIYKKSLDTFGSLFNLTIVNTVVICAGIILLIVPGVIAAARVSFSEFYCVLDKQKAMDAYSSSWGATKEYQWLLASGIIAIAVFTALPVIMFQKILENIGVWNYIFEFFFNIVEYVLLSIITIFSYRVFVAYDKALNNAKQSGTS